jgi:drug/metabolite transporter (DMT)-like permease
VLILGEPVSVWHLVGLGAVIAGSRWAQRPFAG